MGTEPMPSSTRERAVLKIQDGCNHRCAFCIIPTVRGVSTTKPLVAIVAEARAFVREGARELVVTGVSLGDWGHTADTAEGIESQSRRGRRGNRELCTLLRSLTAIEGLERLRVSSLDPADVDEEFLQTVAHTPKISPHIHLALQAGGAPTLRRMRRRYTPEQFLKVARRWREIRPDGGLTTDIIVGFPGESTEDFEGSLHIARSCRFSAIHVFPYSPRAGTAAAGFSELVPAQEQARRVDALLALAGELASEYAAQFVGRKLPVLVESITGDGTGDGLIPHYVRAHIENLPPHVARGDVVEVEVGKWRNDVLQCNVAQSGAALFEQAPTPTPSFA
jgi:threonylcarbamoyladenosine tRNA methylthiotransferase MtaB